MEVVEVEIIGAQPRQAFVDGLPHSGAGKAGFVGGIAHFHAHFAGQHHAVAAALERFSQHGFGHALVVHVGGIEKIDAVVDAGIDDALCPGLIGLRAERHGAEAGPRNHQIRSCKSQCVHQSHSIVGE